MTTQRAALATWENEGGQAEAPLAELGEHESLPPGYRAQPTWGFHEGRAFCEFNRVYGPPVRRDKRGPICYLDEDLSYWNVTREVSRAGDVRTPPEWLRYGDARKPPNSA